MLLYQWGGRYGIHVGARLYQLGVSALTLTSDAWLVVALRAKSVGTMPGVWHAVPAVALQARAGGRKNE